MKFFASKVDNNNMLIMEDGVDWYSDVVYYVVTLQVITYSSPVTSLSYSRVCTTIDNSTTVTLHLLCYLNTFLTGYLCYNDLWRHILMILYSVYLKLSSIG